MTNEEINITVIENSVTGEFVRYATDKEALDESPYWDGVSEDGVILRASQSTGHDLYSMESGEYARPASPFEVAMEKNGNNVSVNGKKFFVIERDEYKRREYVSGADRASLAYYCKEVIGPGNRDRLQMALVCAALPLPPNKIAWQFAIRDVLEHAEGYDVSQGHCVPLFDEAECLDTVLGPLINAVYGLIDAPSEARRRKVIIAAHLAHQRCACTTLV